MSDPVARLNAALQGRYAIERELGEGGMATVYLADDLKHERKVALKVLKPELAAVVGGERFLAEIKTTANLQHPHILPLFDSGEADGFLFYVMPYVEGESLREKLDHERQLPVDEAVRIASDVAEALEYAHGHGVIHRDIKPANILLQAGRPVIADFGIALALRAGGGDRLTETGLSVGTPHYMSPEQATGSEHVGTATDTYALGCVLYEMLIGEPPFTGSSPPVVLGKIIAGKLESTTEQRASVPANVDAAIRRALEKLPADRFAGAQEFAKALSEANFRHGEPDTAGSDPVAIRWHPMMAAFAVILVAVGMLLGWTWLAVLTGATESFGPRFLALAASLDVTRPRADLNPTVAFSPDGTKIVYVGSSEGRRLYLQDFSRASGIEPIEGTDGASNPFFSPDGDWVAFVAGDKLKKVSLAGGQPSDLDGVVGAGAFRGGVWGRDGYIYYTPANEAGIWRVTEDGEDAGQLTTPATDYLEFSHRWPELLPGGKYLLFTSCCNGPPRIKSLDLATLDTTLVQMNAFSPRYLEPGYLLFGQRSSLFAARFDPETLEIGTPFPVVPDVVAGNEQLSDYDVSETGSLIYLSGISQFERVLVRIDSAGVSTPLFPGPRFCAPGMSFDPNGQRLAFALRDDQMDIHIYDFDRGTFDPFTSSIYSDFYPLWSPDGNTIAFTSTRNDRFDLWVRPADLGGPPELLYESEHSKWPLSWSSDSKFLAFGVDHPDTGEDIWIYSIDERIAEPLMTEQFDEWSAAFSPDGRWLAYERIGGG